MSMPLTSADDTCLRVMPSSNRSTYVNLFVCIENRGGTRSKLGASKLKCFAWRCGRPQDRLITHDGD